MPYCSQKCGQTVLPEVPVRDMPDIMTECDCLDKILVQTKASPDRSCNLGNELDMNDTMGDVVVFHKGKDLGLVNVPGVCPCMDDPVSITGVGCTDILGFSVVPPDGIGTD